MVYRPGGPVAATVYDRDRLPSGARLEGPALVEALDTTIVVPEEFSLSVDEFGTTVLERAS
jgi:N-methylhydantoinase A/oxoprolinase/acetone carboxylase beta subunit